MSKEITAPAPEADDEAEKIEKELSTHENTAVEAVAAELQNFLIDQTEPADDSDESLWPYGDLDEEYKEVLRKEAEVILQKIEELN